MSSKSTWRRARKCRRHRRARHPLACLDLLDHREVLRVVCVEDRLTSHTRKAINIVPSPDFTTHSTLSWKLLVETRGACLEMAPTASS